ncbi:CDP-alcohol phosphatidyltransferase family protein [Rhodospirillaceae bacterium SYSU D60014]|uniref:CDP-alcohol phosphatidyltransferase family protein n=1 Tax=Virgifigura deserti TaxID=2268457 RepID=UPI000E66AAF3
MRVWIDAVPLQETIRVFGMTLLERHLRALKRLSPRLTEICIDLGPSSRAAPLLPRDMSADLPLTWARGAGSAAERLLTFANSTHDTAVLAMSADTLVDPRLYEFMADQPGSCAARSDPEAGMDSKGTNQVVLLRLAPGAGDGLRKDAGSLAALVDDGLRTGRLEEVRPEAFPGFIRVLRRTLPFYLFYVADEASRARVERFLFDANYKGSTDFFTKYVYPPLVWQLLRPLARARIHPNWVTVVSIILTFAAVPLFAAGWFLPGLVFAYVMSVLDSVDGKLARLTFSDSALGNILDHGLDIVHPPLWYLAWAWGLSGGDAGSAVFAAAIWMTVFYILDRLVLMIYRARFKRGLHAHGALDARVRTFISRRNINLPIFTVGVLTGYALEAFYFIVFWQIVTVVWHAGRTAWIVAIERPRAAPAGGSSGG